MYGYKKHWYIKQTTNITKCIISLNLVYLGINDTMLVDKNTATNDPSIYALGNCIEMYHSITNPSTLLANIPASIQTIDVLDS